MGYEPEEQDGYEKGQSNGRGKPVYSVMVRRYTGRVTSVVLYQRWKILCDISAVVLGWLDSNAYDF